MSTPKPTEPSPIPTHDLSGLVPAQGNRKLLIGGGIVVFVIVLVVLLSNSRTDPGWQDISPGGASPQAVHVDQVSPDTVYLGTETGQVFRSDDRGVNWTPAIGGIPTNVAISALQTLPDGQSVLAGTSGGAYLSHDNGAHWAASNTGLPAGDGIDAFALGDANGQVIIAATEHHGIFVSHDSGTTWAANSGGLPEQADVYSLLISPDYATWYAGLIGASLFTSHDSGATWTTSNTGLPTNADIYALASRAEGKGLDIYAATNAGVYLSLDSGATWAASTSTIGTARVNGILIDPVESSLIVATTAKGVYESADSGKTWGLVNGFPNGKEANRVATSHTERTRLTLYVTADKLYLFPAQGSSGASNVLKFALLAALIGLIIWLTSRQGKIMKSLTPNAPPPGAPGRLTRNAQERASANQTAATRHIRGGPPPTPPRVPDEDESN